MSFPRYPEYKDSGVEWLGKVPGHWHIYKLKHFTHFIGGGTPSRDKPEFWSGDIPWVSPKDMKSERINGAEECITEEGLLGSSSSLIAEGRVLMVVRSGILKHTIPVAINDVPVALNQDMKALTFAGEKCLSSFFWRWVQGLNDRLLLAWSKPGATVDSIEHDYLAETRIPLPPIDEQLQITLFLERETAKIDRLMTEQEKLIKLLKEKRQAVISHAVTKGLDPTVPMKDSGVEWLGEVPAHWAVISLGRVTQEKCDGPFGSGLKSEHYTESGVRVIRLQNIRQDGFDGSDEAFIDAEYYQSTLAGRDVVAGDVLIAGLGDERNTVGRACVAPEDIAPAMVKADCFRFRLFAEIAVPTFVARQLSVSSSADAGALATGTTRSRIPLTVMATRTVSLPPAKEQQEIVSWIEQEMVKLDALCAECEQAIELLKERRTALISAAVTGRIDVRGLIKDEQEQAA